MVVATRDRVDSLRRTLRALADQRTEREWEIVLVDDGSTPPVPEDLYDAPRVRLVRGRGEGPARARNRGWREARGQVVLFTDDDVEPCPDWLESACAYLERSQSAAGVEGPTKSAPYDRLRAMSVESEGPGGFLTANLAFRREVLERLGGFYEGFPFPHCEDYDLAFRAEAVGPVGFSPGMRVLHHPRAMTAAELARRGRLGASEIVLFRRHRERYGRIRRLPAVAFPFLNALVEWSRVARRDVHSLRDAIAWLRIVAGYTFNLTRQVLTVRRRRPGRALKVLFVMPLAHRHGGAEAILWNFLRNVDRSRLEPAVVFFDDGPFRDEVASLGMASYVLRPDECPRPRIALFPPRLARIVRREAPDLIFSWLVEAQPFASIAGVLTGRAGRIAWWQANMPQADFVERMATALPARAVFMYSRATAEVQRSIWPHRETIVVHPGIDAPERMRDAELARLRAELGLPDDRPVVGIVGRLCSWKGQHHVVRAIALLRDRGHPVHGLIVGGNAYDFEPDYEPRLRALAEELRLERDVTFTGQVPDGTVHMQLMDAMANASDHEPFGIVLLEAMALGVPVVAVEAGGPAEFVDDGASGLLVPSATPEHLADAFERVLFSGELRERLAAGGRQAVEERYTTERMVGQITDSIERLAA